MDDEQTKRIRDAVVRLMLDEFRADFEKILEVTYTFTKEVPGQADSGTRNVFSHLANSMAQEDYALAELELTRARKHLRAAKYDCLSVLVIARVDYLESYVESVEDLNGGMFIGDIRHQLSEIKQDRAALTPQSFIRRDDETDLQQDITSFGQANDQLEAIAIKCNKFEVYLKEGYPVPEHLVGRSQRRTRRVRRIVIDNFFALVVAVVGAVVGAIVFGLWIEERLHIFRGPAQQPNVIQQSDAPTVIPKK